jgi:GDPmannose 4,6-dehydratase
MGREIEWIGSGLDEKGIDKKNGDVLLEIDQRYFRPTEVEYLLGDCTKAKEKLGWQAKESFNDLVKEMVEADLKNVRSELNRSNREG